MLTSGIIAFSQLNDDGGDATLMMRKSVSSQSHQPYRNEPGVLRGTVFNVEVHASTVDRLPREPDTDEEEC